MNTQEKLFELIWQEIQIREKRGRILHFLKKLQRASLHLKGEGGLEPLQVSLVPIVLGREDQSRLINSTRILSITKMALMERALPETPLFQFLTYDLEDISLEMIRANSFRVIPAQHRWRTDTYYNPGSNRVNFLETNGGEPQGAVIINDAIKFTNSVLTEIFNLRHNFISGPNILEQEIDFLQKRWLFVSGRNETPAVGYMAWRDSSSLSGLEAQYSARYCQQTGRIAYRFSPLDIVDIRVSQRNNPYYTVYIRNQETNWQEKPLVIVRRLLGEVMEHLNLWKQFREGNGSKLCSDGKDTIWHRFITNFSPQQMVNPLNSLPTSKELDAILSTPSLREIFLLEKLSHILSIPSERQRFGIPQDMDLPQILEILDQNLPETHVMRRREDGLIPNGTISQGLSSAQIQAILNHREDWVLKMGALVGHSGAGVHVGRNLQFAELPAPVLSSLSNQACWTLCELTPPELKIVLQKNSPPPNWDSILGRRIWSDSHFQILKNHPEQALRMIIDRRQKQLSQEQQQQIMSEIWSTLVKYCLKTTDTIIQRAVIPPQQQLILLKGNGEILTHEFNYDLNPQTIGGETTYIISRFTASVKTNITGGWGGLATSLKESIITPFLT